MTALERTFILCQEHCAVTKIPRGALQFSSTVGVTVLPNFVAENGFTIVVLLVWSQAPPALSPGPLLEGPALDPQ